MSPYLKRPANKSSLPPPSIPAARKSPLVAKRNMLASYGDDETRTLLRPSLEALGLDDDSTNDCGGNFARHQIPAPPSAPSLVPPRVPSFASPSVLTAPPPPPRSVPSSRMEAMPEPFVAPEPFFAPYSFAPAPPSSFAPVTSATMPDSQSEMPVPPVARTQRTVFTKSSSSRVGLYATIAGGAVLGLFMAVLGIQANENAKANLRAVAASEAQTELAMQPSLPAPPVAPVVVDHPVVPAAVAPVEAVAPSITMPAAPAPVAVTPVAQAAHVSAPAAAPVKVAVAPKAPAPVVRAVPVRAPAPVAAAPVKKAPEPVAVKEKAEKAEKPDEARKALAEANANIEGSL